MDTGCKPKVNLQCTMDAQDVISSYYGVVQYYMPDIFGGHDDSFVDQWVVEETS